ncbi:sigma-54-dependent Fis family transcriptional regulator [Zavarzinia aquatilis]|uniref:Sigma-54-dependent Fis family transcriptional regulator n=1 Tax=Zavarzinia aquatilis TaxID=2211142 RepID=A0A317DZ81_9PROT|nr:sigma-54-dependent Fis family transcriptional regulator [Zavarzinia aquatilis]PWR19534.1 sigma-54-dependent Fis family transcriptional regulator [Zavarzinia aquatilis]
MLRKRLIEQFNLRSRLKFDVEGGRIWLDENRMLLVHAKALAAVRHELFDTLGPRRAQGVLMRMGFATGRQDADLATKLVGAGNDYDVFNIGPVLHGFEGVVKSEITEAEIDWEKGSFFGTVEMDGSWEAQCHIEQYGVGSECACWSLVGHASGYVSQFFRRFILFREVKCVARGDDRCVMVARPAEAWGDDAFLDNFKSAEGDAPFRELEAELSSLRGRRPSRRASGRLVGASPGFRTAFDMLAKAAATPITVLLLGETGVGKEMFARWLHDNSPRADGPFVAINCGAIPTDLIESELFGVQRGAFTGAQQSRPGRFERADGGTLLLDEVGDLSLAAQVKLLRVLQTGEVERLGDDRLRKVKVRVVAATNVDLKQAVAAGRFRADLYYRLATYPVEIPPLRERKSDIPLLATAMLERLSAVYGKTFLGISDWALRVLQAHHWPGNVRELENLLERSVILAPDGGWIEAEHLFPDGPPQGMDGVAVDRHGHVGAPQPAGSDVDRLLTEGFDLEAHEQRLLRLATDRAGGNLTRAARLLGITRRQLAYRLKRGGGE